VLKRAEVLPTYRVGAPVVCAPTSSVELNGALSNLDLAAFRKLDDLRTRLAAAAPEVPVPWPEPRRQQGWILAAVIEVLEAVGQPMQALEIRVAVEELLGEPVSWIIGQELLGLKH
jgi:hypothetical protein